MKSHFLLQCLIYKLKSPQALYSELAIFGAVVMGNKYCSKFI